MLHFQQKDYSVFDIVLTTFFFVNIGWMGVYCVYLWILQSWQISRNITTNEVINWRHYPYLLDEVQSDDRHKE